MERQMKDQQRLGRRTTWKRVTSGLAVMSLTTAVGLGAMAGVASAGTVRPITPIPQIPRVNPNPLPSPQPTPPPDEGTGSQGDTVDISGPISTNPVVNLVNDLISDPLEAVVSAGAAIGFAGFASGEFGGAAGEMLICTAAMCP